MRATTIFSMLFFVLIMTACNVGAGPANDEAIQTSSVISPLESPPVSTLPPVPAGQAESTSQPGLDSQNCASEQANQLGAAIAEDYGFTSTEQVMGWFCDGAEFEDILVALETADQTGASPEEMLQMLAADMTWEEIWQVVGLAEP